jgi:hypothetical protein
MTTSTTPSAESDLSVLVTQLIELAVHSVQATSGLAEQAFGPARALLDGIAELACASARDVAGLGGPPTRGDGGFAMSAGLPVLGPGQVTGHDVTATFEDALTNVSAHLETKLADESIDPAARALLGAIATELSRRARIVEPRPDDPKRDAGPAHVSGRS